MTEQRWAPLLALDPDLGQLLAPARREEAVRALTVNLRRFDAPTGLERTAPSHLGLLVVDGVLARDVAVPGSVATELLGAGDLIRPWTMEVPVEILETEVRWSPLTEVTVALLDRRAAHELCSYPEVYAALMDRLSQRAARLATTQAIAQMTRVDRRLVALFQHLAERWGRMSGDGVQVPLKLSHRLLGQLVGARRPTISAALSDLARSGELVRRADSTWLVREPALALAA
jgi:CRP/FNR family transcriptional regulator, cyclic AMP receptor protein